MAFSIQHPPTKVHPHFDSVDSILNTPCPKCNSELTVTYRHLGGHFSNVPHVTCSNPIGGETHLLSRIDDELAGDFWQVVRLMEDDFGIHEEMEAADAATD